MKECFCATDKAQDSDSDQAIVQQSNMNKFLKSHDCCSLCWYNYLL